MLEIIIKLILLERLFLKKYFEPSIGPTRSLPNLPPDLLIHPSTPPGFPIINAKSGTSFVTTAPAAMKLYFPITFPQIVELL